MKMKTIFPIFALLALGSTIPAIAADDDLAVVVNKTNPVDNLTKAQLKKMILGEQSSWPGNKKVNVILRATGQPEREGVLRSVCGMSEDDFNQHWMHANLNGDTASPPKSLGSAEAVRQLVMSIPGAIGFLRASDVNATVKVVTVDGLAAGAAGYKIKAGK
jgi:ABC-type phosphate transport system substrate-binding protein